MTPAQMKVGGIYRITPDADDYDDRLAKVVEVNADVLQCDALILTGQHRGETVKEWPFSNFVELSPLELLAEQAE